MDDEDLATTPEDEGDVPEAEEVAADDPDTDDEAVDEEPGDGQAEDDEAEDVEYEGKNYRLPKALKEALLRHADYTQKTQGHAEKVRTFEAEAADRAQAWETERALADHVYKLKMADEQIEQFRGLDWQTLYSEQPDQAQALRIQYDMLKDARETTAREFDTKAHAHALDRQQNFAKRAEQASAETAKLVPDWNDATATKLQSFAKSLGFSDQDIANSMTVDPRINRALYLAQIGQQVLEQRRTKPKSTPKTEPKPVPAVGGRARTSPRLSDKMSDEAWVRERNKQLAKRSGTG